MTAPTPTRGRPRPSTGPSDAVKALAATAGIPADEMHDYLYRCATVAVQALRAGADDELTAAFFDRVPVPTPSTPRNSMPTPLPTSRPHNVVGRPWLGAVSPWAHRTAPTAAAGHGLFVRQAGGPLQKVRADGRFETVSARATPACASASKAAQPRQLPVAVLVATIREALGPLPVNRH